MSSETNLLLSYSLLHRFIWYRVAKVATRSVNSLLRDNVCDYVYLDGGKVPVELGSSLDKGFFRFAFVRNPRIDWSRWSNKIRKNSDKHLSYLR